MPLDGGLGTARPEPLRHEATADEGPRFLVQPGGPGRHHLADAKPTAVLQRPPRRADRELDAGQVLCEIAEESTESKS